VTRAVIDTNVVVSAVLNRAGVPAAVVRAAGSRFELVWTPAIAVECGRILASTRIVRRLKGREDDGRAVLSGLAAIATMVPPELLPALRVVQEDPDDDVLFGAAMAGGARFVVSGDAAVLAVGNFAGVLVVSASEFLATLGA
jgi:putative PIN family toxin of toxin-antitoxin system